MFEDASRHRAADDVRQILTDRDHGDDDLGRVSEARVEQAADAGAGVFTRVFGCLPDQPGEGDEGDRGEHEQDRLAGMGDEVDKDRDGRERKRGPEESSRHGGLA